MAKKSHGPDAPPDPDAIVAAALALAAETGWRRLPLADIAARAGVSLAELIRHFPTKTAILDAYVAHIDQHMMAGGTEAGESHRDRLFDVIMRRFDAMAGNRRALEVIMRESADDPWAVLCGGRRFLRSMALVLETAGISAAGLPGMVKTQAIAAIYLYVFKTFVADDSPDHARTMAALDKGLKRASDWYALVFRHHGSGRHGAGTTQR